MNATSIDRHRGDGPGAAPSDPTGPDPTGPPANGPRTVATGSSWRTAVAVLLVPLAVGAVLGTLMPRGPATAGLAVATVAVSLAVGAVVGRAWTSRWAWLVTPGLLAVGFELARLPTTGPSVDLPSIATMFGWLALIGGRGLLALTVGLPSMLGVVLARGVPRLLRTRRPDAAGVRTVLAMVLLVALTVVVGRPARTAPILGPDGRTLPDSVAELTRIPVDGHDLAVMVRGHHVDNPVLLFLAGGPGGTELGAMRRHLPGLEEHVTVVTWDQRGTGRSYGALDPTETYTLQSAVDDTIAVAEHLRSRFDRDAVHLVGQSWGSTLGVLAVQQRPDLFSSYVGVGQMVSQTATDRIGYRDTLAWARDRGMDGLVSTLEENGPPPYEDVADYEHALSHEPEVYSYDHRGNAEGAGGFSENLLVGEYSTVDLFHVFPGFLDTASVLYPQLVDVDFRRDVGRLDVPVHFVQGAHETTGRAELFAQWYAELDAPSKQQVVFDRSGHRPMFEQPDRFVAYITDAVLDGTD